MYVDEYRDGHVEVSYITAHSGHDLGTCEYGISVFITRKSRSGSYYWEEVKPLKSEGLSYPVIPPDTVPSDFHVPSHIEICYYDGAHYDSVVSMVTNKVSQCTPQTPQTLSIPNVSNTVVID